MENQCNTDDEFHLSDVTPSLIGIIYRVTAEIDEEVQSRPKNKKAFPQDIFVK